MTQHNDNKTTDSLAVDSASAGSLLEWANEEGAKVYWTDYPIADTGDWSTVWTCETEDRKGYGHTFADSIEDAMKEATDPTKWDYVPDFEAENTGGES